MAMKCEEDESIIRKVPKKVKKASKKNKVKNEVDKFSKTVKVENEVKNVLKSVTFGDEVENCLKRDNVENREKKVRKRIKVEAEEGKEYGTNEVFGECDKKEVSERINDRTEKNEGFFEDEDYGKNDEFGDNEEYGENEVGINAETEENEGFFKHEECGENEEFGDKEEYGGSEEYRGNGEYGENKEYVEDEEAEFKEIDTNILLAEYQKEHDITKEEIEILRNLRVQLFHEVPQQHEIEKYAGLASPTPEERRRMREYVVLKKGLYCSEEDKRICKNWKKFCKKHNWDRHNVKPFLYQKHGDLMLIRSLADRKRFVQFLAKGLPDRTLNSVYQRFRSLNSGHLRSRYTPEEDEIILKYIEQNPEVDPRSMHADLAKVLNRTRDSVLRRCRLLTRKEDSLAVGFEEVDRIPKTGKDENRIKKVLKRSNDGNQDEKVSKKIKAEAEEIGEFGSNETEAIGEFDSNETEAIGEFYPNETEEIGEFDSNETEEKDMNILLAEYKKKHAITNEEIQTLRNLKVQLFHVVPHHQKIEKVAGSHAPTREEKRRIQQYVVLKEGVYSPQEDEQICENWRTFCKEHNWDQHNVHPFMYLRHGIKYGKFNLIRDLDNRKRFVQFLAKGLPNRTLYSIYQRFRNLNSDHLQCRYTPDEDETILNYIEQNSEVDPKHMHSDLAKVLNRTRASVWRRYRLLKEKRESGGKPCNIKCQKALE